jgi:hypothetical protein
MSPQNSKIKFPLTGKNKMSRAAEKQYKSVFSVRLIETFSHYCLISIEFRLPSPTPMLLKLLGLVLWSLSQWSKINVGISRRFRHNQGYVTLVIVTCFVAALACEWRYVFPSYYPPLIFGS